MTDEEPLYVSPGMPYVQIDRVPEWKLDAWRRANQKTREPEDIRAHEQLIRAERDLWDAVVCYLVRGGSQALSEDIVRSAAAYYDKQRQQGRKA